MTDILILVSVLLLSAGTLPAPPKLSPSTPPLSSSTTIGCADELVAFSPCLQYICESPNNISGSPPVQCCDNFAAAFDDNTAICLCYFVHNPQLFGFPINYTKLMSLTSVCPVKEKVRQENFSLEFLCSGSTELPPFRSITDHRDSRPSPRHPLPPSPSPRPPGDHDNLSPQEPPGSGSSSPPFSDVGDDNPSPAAQGTTSCSSAIEIMCNYRLWVLSAAYMFLHLSHKYATSGLACTTSVSDT
ncbi:unnamed protein product [Withania somnifera]